MVPYSIREYTKLKQLESVKSHLCTQSIASNKKAENCNLQWTRNKQQKEQATEGTSNRRNNELVNKQQKEGTMN